MAKKKGNNGRLLMYGGILALGVAGYIMTEPTPTPRRTSSGRKPPVNSGSNKTASELFTDEDYNTKFARLNAPVKNSFRPLVMPSSARSTTGLGALLPNEIPADFTDGKTKWLYTGTAIVDGAPMALVENPETGEGEFIKVGQRWKNAIVRKITPTSLALEGPNGRARTLQLMQDPVEDETTLAGMEVRPATPNIGGNNNNNNLAGPIGGRTPGATTAPPNGAAAQENERDRITSE